ncbi:hypothetical protein [Parenemella sanctibonifatiensis]|uniref:DUF559 domain-containing protein n=1 Tax=Parenemella sanctibonifatiensis TaxID=2016505 RepID=A0A255ECS8_9ACTN|nr:hypothetical protein [Parenemella sanctibonifatiensis]OYN89359.1 hypothetical protein CGZ91_10670 [Parenemella sanctibonifatiensis]
MTPRNFLQFPVDNLLFASAPDLWVRFHWGMALIMTGADWRDRGVTRSQLSGPRYLRLFRNVYARTSDHLSDDDWVAAARLAMGPDTVATGLAALRHHGCPHGASLPVHLATTRIGVRSRPGIRISHVAELPPHSGGVASAVSAYAAYTAYAPLVDAVAAGDWLLENGQLTAVEMQDLGAAYGGRLRHLAKLVRTGAQSWRETQLRLALVLAGLPEPAINVAVDHPGRVTFSPDLSYDQYRLALEYEGRQHLTDTEQWSSDIERYEELSLRWRILRVTAERMRRPRELVTAVWQELRAGGYRGPAPRFAGAWCTAFPW